ncbi:CHAD domain-containing protein [Mesorhizobium sp. KR1-2]|uniref:CYTH and CHAD domain-containing protein n=1 Tax=Mesorhizobium sp. KR1-2 TaxID=3156609 RepID=UPI0032B3D68C
MAAGREVEVRLTVPSGELRRLGRAAAQAGAKRTGAPKTIRSVYFDTRKHRLHDKGYLLRIRRNGQDSVQTVRTIKPTNDGLGRSEWDAAMHGDRPVAAAAEHSPLSKLLRKQDDWEKLRPVFTVEVDRDTYLLERGDTTIEITLDEGVVSDGHAEQNIAEAELELKTGDPQALFAFAREISAGVPSLVSLTSKGERGYRLLAGDASRPTTSLVFDLSRDMSTAEAIRAIGLTCLSALFDNLAILIAGAGMEALHQSRVCVRRLRAIMSLFGGVLEWEDETALKAELKWLSDLLGEGRETDVFLKSVLEPTAAANPDIAGFTPFLADFHERHDKAYADIIANLHSDRVSRLSLDLVSHFDALLAPAKPPGKAGRKRGMTIKRFAAKALRRRLRSLLQDSRKMEQLKPQELHRIRIRAKKLRYMAEPFAGIVSWKRFDNVVSSLHAIQDALGDLNDCKVNREIALAYAQKVLAGPGDHSSLVAAGLVTARCAGNETTALSKARVARDSIARVSALRFKES